MSAPAAEHPQEALRASGLDLSALRAGAGLAIAEIAGRDSVAAVVAAVREHGFGIILPTAVSTGTEYGDEGTPERAAALLAQRLGSDAEVLPLVRLGSAHLWAALNGRWAAALSERFGIFSPCLACHLYMHLCRVPLSWLLGDVPVIAGERDSHGGTLKLSQMPLGIDACVRVLAHAGVELLEPVRHVHDPEVIVGLVGGGWEQGAQQLGCVLGGNYVGLDGVVVHDQLAYARYVRGFLEPAGRAVVDAWRAEPEPDYESIVRAVLSGPEAA
jgi:hypothetical protein